MSQINTPFSDRGEVLASKSGANLKTKKLAIIAGVSISALFLIFILSRSLFSDSYRTLEVISVDELVDNHERLLNGKYKLVATVDAELGTESGKGKLVAFRDADSKDIVPVMISQEIMDNKSLSKGQRYKMEVEVTRGGLLYANQLDKD